jgi:ABC-type Fe3+ transport system substrate-binding protein
MVVRVVGSGQAAIGMTDSDDIASGQEERLPIVALPVNPETLSLPNAVAVVRDAPHPVEAEELFEYLRRPEVSELLVSYRALEGTSAKLDRETGISVEWTRLISDLEPVTGKLSVIFLR